MSPNVSTIYVETRRVETACSLNFVKEVRSIHFQVFQKPLRLYDIQCSISNLQSFDFAQDKSLIAKDYTRQW